MSYQFAGQLFDRREDAVSVVVETFISAEGANSPQQIDEWLADPDFPASCADEMLADWDCNIATTGAEPEYPTKSEIVEAIQKLKASDFE